MAQDVSTVTRGFREESRTNAPNHGVGVETAYVNGAFRPVADYTESPGKWVEWKFWKRYNEVRHVLPAYSRGLCVYCGKWFWYVMVHWPKGDLTEEMEELYRKLTSSLKEAARMRAGSDISDQLERISKWQKDNGLSPGQAWLPNPKKGEDAKDLSKLLKDPYPPAKDKTPCCKIAELLKAGGSIMFFTTVADLAGELATITVTKAECPESKEGVCRLQCLVHHNSGSGANVILDWKPGSALLTRPRDVESPERPHAAYPSPGESVTIKGAYTHKPA